MSPNFEEINLFQNILNISSSKQSEEQLWMFYKNCWKWTPMVYRQVLMRSKTSKLVWLMVSWLYPSVKLFTYFTRDSIDAGFSSKIKNCASTQIWRSLELRSGLCAFHGFAVIRQMSLPWNFSLRNVVAAYVQCGGAPSCIYHNEENNAVCLSLGQTFLYRRLK